MILELTFLISKLPSPSIIPASRLKNSLFERSLPFESDIWRVVSENPLQFSADCMSVFLFFFSNNFIEIMSIKKEKIIVLFLFLIYIVRNLNLLIAFILIR